jgi:hypothetical protein
VDPTDLTAELVEDTLRLSSEDVGFAILEDATFCTLFVFRFSISTLLLTDCVLVDVSVRDGIPDRCGTGSRLEDVGILDIFPVTKLTKY